MTRLEMLPSTVLKQIFVETCPHAMSDTSVRAGTTSRRAHGRQIFLHTTSLVSRTLLPICRSLSDKQFVIADAVAAEELARSLQARTVLGQAVRLLALQAFWFASTQASAEAEEMTSSGYYSDEDGGYVSPDDVYDMAYDRELAEILKKSDAHLRAINVACSDLRLLSDDSTFYFELDAIWTAVATLPSCATVRLACDVRFGHDRMLSCYPHVLCVAVHPPSGAFDLFVTNFSPLLRHARHARHARLNHSYYLSFPFPPQLESFDTIFGRDQPVQSSPVMHFTTSPG